MRDLYTSCTTVLAAVPAVAHLIGITVVGMSFLAYDTGPPVLSGIGYAVTPYILSLIGLYTTLIFPEGRMGAV